MWAMAYRPVAKNWFKMRILHLTRRERQVLDGAWRGETVQETATRLTLAPRTVEAYRRSARMAMSAPTTMTAVRAALRAKLLTNLER